MRPYGQGVGLCVDDPVVKIDDRVIIRKQKEEIFKRLSKEEALHLVPVLHFGRVHHIVDGSVPSLFESSVLLKCLEDVPAPLTVLLLLGESVHVEERFHSLWSEEVVTIKSLAVVRKGTNSYATQRTTNMHCNVCKHTQTQTHQTFGKNVGKSGTAYLSEQETIFVQLF